MRRTIGYELDQDLVLAIVEKALIEFLKLPENRDLGKKGGLFTLKDRNGRFVFSTHEIGEVPAKKVTKYRNLSREKADRLTANPDHISSWQSRDPEEKKYGGAILVGDLILSFSGLTEHGDETVMLLTAMKILEGRFDPRRLYEIAEISNNPFVFLCGETHNSPAVTGSSLDRITIIVSPPNRKT